MTESSKSAPSEVWGLATTQRLASVLAAIADVVEMECFLRDVMTEKEIVEISARLEAARLLSEGVTYTRITEKTQLSSRTIARISDWLSNGLGGYAIALSVLEEQTK